MQKPTQSQCHMLKAVFLAYLCVADASLFVRHAGKIDQKFGHDHVHSHHSKHGHSTHHAHAHGHSSQMRSTEAVSEGAAARLQGRLSLAANDMAFAEANVGRLVMHMLTGRGTTGMAVKQAEHIASKHMHYSEAVRRLKSKLPKEVMSLVRQHADGSDAEVEDPQNDFSEESIEKALKILNGMIFDAWKDLDDAVISCKEYEERNRGTFDQVDTDLSRLGEQISDLERQRIEANEGIQAQNAEFESIKAQRTEEIDGYTKDRWENQHEMSLRKQDLAVMRFVLELTKCDNSPQASSLVQTGTPVKATKARACNVEGGSGLQLQFDNPKLEEEVMSKMTPSAQKDIRKMLAELGVQNRGETAFAQQDNSFPHDNDEDDDDDDSDADEDDESKKNATKVSQVTEEKYTKPFNLSKKVEQKKAIQVSPVTKDAKPPHVTKNVEDKKASPAAKEEEQHSTQGNKETEATHTQPPKESKVMEEKKVSQTTKKVDADKGIEVPQVIKMVEAKKVVEKENFQFPQTQTTTTTMFTTTVGFMRGPPPRVTPVAKNPSPTVQWKKCRNEPVDCGLLHDNMSLMWGKAKDRVDELQMEMEKNEGDHAALLANFNEQNEVIRIAKARYMMMLAEAISNLNGDQSESSDKEQRKHTLDSDFKKKMRTCKATITEIMFTNICAVRKVRNEVLAESTVIVVSELKDCDFTDWKADDCSMECDDECPKADPYACGGWQKLRREIVEHSNPHGVQCPPLMRKKKCNQVRCPVDCQMSQWSGWSKCTKECEGGVSGRNRAIMMKPRDGGATCDTVQETQPCNTGSCDRDCTLAKWTQWEPCSMACGGGVQERVRKVVVPIRGEGLCPKDLSPERWEEDGCNLHDCVGDEVCIASQDMILAIDGSGSMREEGFKILRDFAADLVDRYEAQYFGQEAMKVGVIMFGNGEVLEDGTVSSAINVHELSSDMASVKASIKALTWQKGFTNMAQAFTKAEEMWQLKGRKDGQSAIAVLTDGKPTFLFQTNSKVHQLKDKAIKIYFAPVMRFMGKELDLLKRWASHPWETHLVHIPGLMPLAADHALFAGQLVATFCPLSMSPSSERTTDLANGYILLKENGRCGERGALLGKEFKNAGACASVARAAGARAFTFGSWFRNGWCYAEKMAVDDTKMEGWLANRRDPICHEGDGKWIDDRLFDLFVMDETTR